LIATNVFSNTANQKTGSAIRMYEMIVAT